MLTLLVSLLSQGELYKVPNVGISSSKF